MVADRENSALGPRRDLPQTGRPAPGAHLHSDRGAPMTSKCTAHCSRPRRDPFTEPPSGVRRSAVLKYHPGWPLPRHHRRDRLPNVLPLVQHRTSPWRDRDAHPGRRAPQSNPERAGAARADPSSRLDLVIPNASSHNRMPPPQAVWINPPTHNRRNCSYRLREHLDQTLHRLALPGTDLVRMDLMLRGDLLQRPVHATFAFSSPENRRRLLLICIPPSGGGIHLSAHLRCYSADIALLFSPTTAGQGEF